VKIRKALDLTRRDYRALLTAMEIADWVLHAFRVEEPRETAPIRAVHQKVYALAGDFGFGELVEHDPVEKRWFPTLELEESGEAMDFIEDFENESFWDTLLERLAERDLLREIGEDAFRALEPVEREERLDPYRRLYAEEFMSHGMERLEILRPASGEGSRLS
jgi:hypothetical protein